MKKQEKVNENKTHVYTTSGHRAKTADTGTVIQASISLFNIHIQSLIDNLLAPISP